MPDTRMRSAKFTTTSFALGGAPIKIHYYRSTPVPTEGTHTPRKYPVLLLHGFPQTSFMWKEVVRSLGGEYELIVPDLRGYGRSSKPKGSETHIEYSKREMAADMFALMDGLGFPTFDVVAHDRGARVTHRLILDNPSAVRRVMLIDIAPTLTTFESVNQDFATGYWHWFTQILPAPLTENLIKSAGDAWWEAVTHQSRGEKFRWDESAEKMYKNAYFVDEAIHAACEDYRAAASIDLEHDRASRAAGQKISVQALRIIWGKRGQIEKSFGEKTVDVWKACSKDDVDVSGKTLDAAHYVPEERSAELVQEIREFLG